MEINGIAHVILTTHDFPRARAFYAQLLPFLGLVPLVDVDGYYYCIGGRSRASALRFAARSRRLRCFLYR